MFISINERWVGLHTKKYIKYATASLKGMTALITSALWGYSLLPEQGSRCRSQDMAAVRGPRQKGDPTSSDTLKRYTTFCSHIPNLRYVLMSDVSTVKMSGLKMKCPLRTIIAVSIGDADTRREPLGDQAMEVTGEWPGWDKTCAQPDEGLDRTEHK